MSKLDEILRQLEKKNVARELLALHDQHVMSHQKGYKTGSGITWYQARLGLPTSGVLDENTQMTARGLVTATVPVPCWCDAEFETSKVPHTVRITSDGRTVEYPVSSVLAYPVPYVSVEVLHAVDNERVLIRLPFPSSLLPFDKRWDDRPVISVQKHRIRTERPTP